MSAAEDQICELLSRRYGCHTVLLYGSRALGTATADSDWDVLGISSRDSIDWCHEALNGIGDLAAFIFPETAIPQRPNQLTDLTVPLNEFTRLRQARVLTERNGFGQHIIRMARQLWEMPPPPLPAQLRAVHQQRARRLVAALAKAPEDPAVRLKQAELLARLPELYFSLRRQWVQSPADNLARLAAQNPAAHQLLLAALAPAATAAQLAAACEALLSEE